VARRLSSADALVRWPRYGATWIVFPIAIDTGRADAPRRPAVALISDHAAISCGPMPPSSVIDMSGRRRCRGAGHAALAAIRPRAHARRGPWTRWLDRFLHRQSYRSRTISRVFHYLGGDWHGLASYSAGHPEGGGACEHYSNLGSALYALGDLDAARRSFAIALAEVPPYGRREKENLRGLLREVEAASAGRSAPGR
jgi:hypothetical protein